MRADERYQDKMVYAYFGGSGKKLNQEVIGTDVRPNHDRLRLPHRPRTLHLRSVQRAELQETPCKLFVDGIADWEAKEPGVKKQMVIAFGLFSMPPGGINKQPNVDYHVWMDQQMNVVANIRCWRTWPA